MRLTSLAAAITLFVQAAAASTTSVFSARGGTLALRHCNYVFSATPFELGVDDFVFTQVPALNGENAGVSFQSTNFPTRYVTVNTTDGTLILGEAPNADDASFSLVTALAASVDGGVSLLALTKAPAWAGQYVTVSNQNKAPCGYSLPSGDAVLTKGTDAVAATWILGTAPPVLPVTIDVDTANVTNPSVNPYFMGCHSDYGFAQTPRTFSSNLIYGSSFEAGTLNVPAWTPSGSSSGSSGLATSSSFSSKPSMHISLGSGGGEYGLVNRGIGGTGFALQGGQPYEVEVWVWSGSQPQAFVELRARGSNGNASASLARVDFTVQSTGPSWGSTWIRYNFTLVPSASTTCEAIDFGSDTSIDCGSNAGPAFVCQRCGAEFVVGLSTPGDINVGFVSLQPGPWGRLAGPNGPLPVLKSGADLLAAMGVKFMRSGGTVSQSMRWKDWRGPVWARPSQQQIWGDSLLSGWGPFEVIDMAEAIGATPSITLAYDTNDEDDWADLVEYCWGSANTSWGRRRIADGHPAPYNLTFIELGNEQYNPHYIGQVAAIEARAAQLGTVPPMHYLFPDNGGLNAADAARALQLGLPVERMGPDLHVGAGGAVAAAAQLFANPPVNGFNSGAINQETNANTLDLQRALNEAADLITWFTAPTAITGRLFARTASFCTGFASHFDSWTQAISFAAHDKTWFQPPGYVHVMITNTWAEQVLAASSALPFAAQRKADGSALVFRAVNQAAAAQPITVNFAGAPAAGAATLWTLSGPTPDALNTYTNSSAIAPVEQQLQLQAGATTLTFTLPPLSFGIVEVPLH